MGLWEGGHAANLGAQAGVPAVLRGVIVDVGAPAEVDVVALATRIGGIAVGGVGGCVGGWMDGSVVVSGWMGW